MKLKRSQVIALGVWLNNNKDRLCHEMPTQYQITSQAQAALGFAVPLSAVGGMMREMGITSRQRGKLDVSGRRTLQRKVHAIEVVVRRLADALDVPYPELGRRCEALEAEEEEARQQDK